MRITLLRRHLRRCNECRRSAIYQLRFRNIPNLLLCNRCAVRLVIGIVEVIAKTQAPHAASKASSRRNTLLRKL